MICCLAIWGASLATPPPAAEVVANTVWTANSFRKESKELEEYNWYKNYRYQGLFLIGIVVVIILIF